jgi:hypothetical protein
MMRAAGRDGVRRLVRALERLLRVAHRHQVRRDHADRRSAARALDERCSP